MLFTGLVGLPKGTHTCLWAIYPEFESWPSKKFWNPSVSQAWWFINVLQSLRWMLNWASHLLTFAVWLWRSQCPSQRVGELLLTVHHGQIPKFCPNLRSSCLASQFVNYMSQDPPSRPPQLTPQERGNNYGHKGPDPGYPSTYAKFFFYYFQRYMHTENLPYLIQ